MISLDVPILQLISLFLYPSYESHTVFYQDVEMSINTRFLTYFKKAVGLQNSLHDKTICFFLYMLRELNGF